MHIATLKAGFRLPMSMILELFRILAQQFSFIPTLHRLSTTTLFYSGRPVILL